MKNGRRFEWLREYQNLQNQKQFVQYKIRKRKLNLARWEDGDLKNIKINERSKAAHLEEVIDELQEQVELIDQVIDDLNEFIATLNDLDSQIVKLKYIDCMKLSEIAEVLGYSDEYIRQRHASISRFIIAVDKYVPDDHDYTQLDLLFQDDEC